MTLCASCGRDKPVGCMTAAGWVCGSCDVRGSVAMMHNRGNGMHRDDRRSVRGRR